MSNLLPWMSNILISSDLLSSFSLSLPCSVISHQACVQADTDNKIITNSETYSALKCCFSNYIDAIWHLRFEWVFQQILLIVTDLQTLPSRTDYVTALGERKSRALCCRAPRKPDSSTSSRGRQADAHRQTPKGSEANLVSPRRTVKAHCHLWAASSIRSAALLHGAGLGEGPWLRQLCWSEPRSAAEELLQSRTHLPMPAGSGACLPARLLRTEPPGAALWLLRAFSCLLGYANAEQQLWSMVLMVTPLWWLCPFPVL